MVQRISNEDLADIRERLNMRANNRAVRERPPLFSSANLNAHYRPLRGLVWSILVHGFICASLVVLPIALAATDDEDLKHAVALTPDELKQVVYLPVMTPEPPTQPPSPNHEPKKTLTPPPAKEGLSYPGPQRILSEPPKATNQFQTLLQPGLIKPPVLQSLMLPNLVRIAEPPRLAPPPAESKFNSMESTSAAAIRSTNSLAPLEIPLAASVRALPPPAVESRFRAVDATAAVGMVSSAIPTMDLTNTVAAPKPPELKPNSNQDLLALSPTPAKTDQPVVVPAGESRGRFAISPDPNLSFNGTEPGFKGDGNKDGNKKDETAKGTATASSEEAKPPAATAAPFAGITILGGVDGPGVPRPAKPEPLQTSYGITILASGGSGGGLKDFGVFGNEQVQTVYLDMRRTIGDRPQSWTVEYAVGQKDITPVNGILNISIRQEVILPFPIDKEIPAWPEDLSRKYSGRMIIAFALITDQGAVEKPLIKDSPDPLLNPAVISALEKWTFRPARRDGEVVPAKILLGIPVQRTE